MVSLSPPALGVRSGLLPMARHGSRKTQRPKYEPLRPPLQRQDGKTVARFGLLNLGNALIASLVWQTSRPILTLQTTPVRSIIPIGLPCARPVLRHQANPMPPAPAFVRVIGTPFM